MQFYHGTTSALNIGKFLRPAIDTGILREEERKINTDVVFVTPSKKSAEMYAMKAASKYGGVPILLEVSPICLSHLNEVQYICRKAKILRKVSI